MLRLFVLSAVLIIALTLVCWTFMKISEKIKAAEIAKKEAAKLSKDAKIAELEKQIEELKKEKTLLEKK